MTRRPPKTYDRAYYDRWYRDPRTRIADAADLRRRAAHLLATAELLLERPARTALDVGCGEARWRAPLIALRPRLRYLGLETSPYAIARFGARRNVREGSFGSLGKIRGRRFDVIVCADVLHYLSPAEIDAGLAALPGLLDGIAYLDATAREDRPSGDLHGWISRPASWYTERFERAGLVNCGMMCWCGPERAERLGAMERR
ncbi:MAG TPA: class I SAM-dependent methyltransferase [Thermoanaerobaculia bacterium]